MIKFKDILKEITVVNPSNKIYTVYIQIGRTDNNLFVRAKDEKQAAKFAKENDELDWDELYDEEDEDDEDQGIPQVTLLNLNKAKKMSPSELENDGELWAESTYILDYEKQFNEEPNLKSVLYDSGT